MTVAIVIVLLLAGFVLLAIEAMAPGVHIFGITGAIFIVGGIAYATVALGPAWGAGTFLVSVLVFVAIVVAALKTGTWKRLTLETEQRKDQGYRSDNETMSQYVGKIGTVLHDLRPVGYMDVGGQRLEAISESDFVAKGQTVSIVRVDGGRLVVRPATPETAKEA